MAAEDCTRVLVESVHSAARNTLNPKPYLQIRVNSTHKFDGR